MSSSRRLRIGFSSDSRQVLVGLAPESRRIRVGSRLNLTRADPQIDEAHQIVRSHQKLGTRREWLEAEAQVQSSTLQSELDSAEARNARLEEQCAEAWKDIGQAKASAAASREKLDARTSLLTTLKCAVKDHAQRLMERVNTLDRALFDVPGGTSAVADSYSSPRSRSPQPPGSCVGSQVENVLGKLYMFSGFRCVST